MSHWRYRRRLRGEGPWRYSAFEKLAPPTPVCTVLLCRSKAAHYVYSSPKSFAVCCVVAIHMSTDLPYGQYVETNRPTKEYEIPTKCKAQLGGERQGVIRIELLHERVLVYSPPCTTPIRTAMEMDSRRQSAAVRRDAAEKSGATRLTRIRGKGDVAVYTLYYFYKYNIIVVFRFRATTTTDNSKYRRFRHRYNRTALGACTAVWRKHGVQSMSSAYSLLLRVAYACLPVGHTVHHILYFQVLVYAHKKYSVSMRLSAVISTRLASAPSVHHGTPARTRFNGNSKF